MLMASFRPRHLALAQFQPGRQEQEQRSRCLGCKATIASKPHNKSMPYFLCLENGREVDSHDLIAKLPQAFDGIRR
jgi:hypothetical protein